MRGKKSSMYASVLVPFFALCFLFVPLFALSGCDGGNGGTPPGIIGGQKTAKVTGVVRDHLGKPISGARIEAYDLGDKLLAAVVSNDRGEFELTLPVGVDVTVKVSAAGYNEAFVYYGKPVDGYNPLITVTLLTGTLTPPPPPIFPE
ncbi:MAG: carboxypeptidase-like regulatory domain-containing protein [Armatimonadota bacterium]|nr:carboxypeptidase-like regulatory domain-containing protein [Armatimonadota bacterium]MCX7776608.1 carboxypeptidase-like regulatory domain-containing protein [Armatimonadota bacterium]MDW8025249.1 carboxypeptidase-like regulatory domain-containing protein [Armatimonadota bacterium]